MNMDMNMVNILHMVHPIINHPADQPFGCCFTGPAMSISDIDSHMLHVWNIYFHKRAILGAIVGSLKWFPRGCIWSRAEIAERNPNVIKKYSYS